MCDNTDIVNLIDNNNELGYGTYFRYTIVITLWLDFLWRSYLGYRQYNTIMSTTKIPNILKKVLNREDFDKCKEYSIAKLKFGFIKDIQDIILNSFLMISNVFAYVWDFSDSLSNSDDEIATSCIWFFLMSLLLTLIDIPLTLYNTFVLEKNFGFNKQTFTFFIWDQTKQFVIDQIIILPTIPITIVIIKIGGQFFFIWLWVVFCCISAILIMIHPILIAPLSDKYTHLPEGDLRSEIEELVNQVEFPLSEIYVIEGSKRSSHSNAYLTGLLHSKRIILYDTLFVKDTVNSYKNDEVLAIVAHELGHWYHNHVVKLMILFYIDLFIQFIILSVILKYPFIYESLGFHGVQPVLIGLIIAQYAMVLYNTLVQFLRMHLSRKFEFEADSFAVSLGKSKPLETALIQLYRHNLLFPVNDNLYSAWYHSHPTVLERISSIKENSEM